MKRVLTWLSALLLALLLSAALAFVVADTSWGHRQIVAQIAAQKSRSGLKIEIGSIEGSIYTSALIKDVRLSDPKGLFFEAPEVNLDWRVLSWLSNRLEIHRLFASQATLHRLPKLRTSGQSRPILPDFDIVIGRVEIARFIVGPAALGTQREGSVVGSAVVKTGRALISLNAALDQGDRLVAKLDAEPDGNTFDVSANMNAPSGGLFAKMMGTDRPVRLDVAGDGDWSQWNGKADAIVSGRPVAQLALAAQKGRFGVNGVLALDSITRGKLQRLTAPLTRINAQAELRNRRLDGTLRLVSSALSTDVSGIADLGANRFDGVAIAARLLRAEALFPNMRGRDVTLKARLNGHFATAAFDYLLQSPQVFFDQTGFENIRASGQGRLSKAPVAVPIRLTASRVTGVGDVAGGILANLSVDGILRVTSKAITGDGLRLKSDKLNGSLGLFVDLKTGIYDVGLQGQLLRYLIPGLGIVDVKTELKVVPGENGRGSRVTGRGQAWVRRFDNGFLASLAGGLPVLETGLVRGSDGVLQLIGLTLKAPSINLSGNGLRRRDGTFQFQGAGRQARYGTLRLSLDGRIERPTLDLYFDRPADALGLAAVRLQMDPTDLGYDWRAQGGSTLGPFSGNGRVLLPRGGTAVIDIAALTTSRMTANGRLTAAGSGLEGRLMLAGGGINGTLDLSPVGADQRIAVQLKARDARFDGPPVLEARRAQFEGTILLGANGTSVDGTVTGQGLSRGGWSLARLAANVRMRNGKGEIRASMAGSRGRSFEVQTMAQVSEDRWRVIGSGTVDRKPIALVTPAVLEREGRGWRLLPAELSFAGGRAKLSGLFGDGANEVSATLAQMPLAILDIVSPGLGLGGNATGSLVYRQPEQGEPAGRADLKVRGLTRSGLVLSSQPIDMGVAATLGSGVAGVRAIAVAGGKEIGRAQARFQPTRDGSLIERFAQAPVFAQLRYNGAADALWRLSGVETLDVSGPVAVGADVSGRVSDPDIRGSIQATNARIESPTTGMVLTGVNVRGRFGNDSKFILDNLSASAGKDGRVTGRGVIDLSSAAGFAMDLALNADNATLIARDDLGATVSGPIRISSDASGGLIAGEVLLNRSRFRLGRAQAAQAVPRLNVREINGLADEVVQPRKLLPWRLAIKAKAPNRVAVTGLGLESEWRADLDIGGTPFSPVIRGRAELIRGDYEFAGRRFEVTRGSIRFQGEDPPDPALDILAAGDTQGISASIRVGGTGQRPEIRFASNPALPEDELLSRILFGTSIANLSAPEAVQLAAAVASLRNGGSDLNPINALRSAIGLDRLRILPADSITGQRTSIAAGKYLSRRAYVELVTDGQGYSATRAEFQITRWLSLLSSISTIGRQSAAVRLSKDY